MKSLFVYERNDISMDNIKVGFIGAGNMGAAIMRGIASVMGDMVSMCAYNPTRSKVEALADCGVAAMDSENDVVKASKYVFLAVKPQKFDEVLTKISEDVTDDTVFVSIAAGITEEYIASKTIPGAKVVLAMPNTPFLLGQGATALAKGSTVSHEEFALVKSIFASGGTTAEIPTDKMKEVIAINGSSPAFIYLFAKGFVDYAASVGISADEALKLFSQSLIGSAKMMTDSGKSIDELIRQVSSPGGTTLMGLEALYEGKLTDTVKDCCERCTKRAYELSK
ncbi:MAG: pyrroline-5-carboxylate reductase [Huintestinicola sp.]